MKNDLGYFLVAAFGFWLLNTGEQVTAGLLALAMAGTLGIRLLDRHAARHGFKM